MALASTLRPGRAVALAVFPPLLLGLAMVGL